ncbi:unnamed protein product [Microthlaspi erraticum]|uniref:BED-type domain-containing protein n=1 Tax=Microthlaspi erraticum TaxID=1685480 RepID=A0A6D2IGM3_9BRAS|nr:unnamed protein product [Microthlaspi erraticum]
MASSKSPDKGKSKRKEADDASGDEVEVQFERQQNKKGKPETERVKPKGKRSWVCDHFDPKEDDKNLGICRHCDKVMLVPSKSGTSNMKKHLEQSCKDFQLWDAANSFASKGRQSKLPNEGEVRLCAVSDKVVREATNELLVLAELPLSFTEHLGWKHFCSKVEFPKPKSRRTTTRDIVEMFVEKKAAMKKILAANSQRLSLTTDICIAPPTGASYMVVTAHFIDAWWNLKKLIIGVKNVIDHKGKTICKVLVDCLAEWDIKKIFCITVDNATANSSALRRFREEFKQLNGEEAMVLDGAYLHLRCATDDRILRDVK